MRKRIFVFMLAFIIVFAFAATALAASNNWTGFKQVRRGDCDYARALAIQNAFWVYGLNTPDSEPMRLINESGGIDGKFGPGTERAVKAFQKNNPPLQVDGIVGAQTWPRMRSRGVLYISTHSNGYRYYGYPNVDGVANFRQYGTTGVWQVDEWAGNFITFEQ